MDDKAKIEALKEVLRERARKQAERWNRLRDQGFQSFALLVQEGRAAPPCTCDKCLLAIANLDRRLICPDWPQSLN